MRYLRVLTKFRNVCAHNLRKDDFKQFKGKLSRIINQYLVNTTHVTESDLLDKMGFPSNWKKISSYRL